MQEQHTRRRGRPLSFDRDTALEKAMLLFWKYGYEATSISDLTQTMGITAPSLYAAFGDKRHLFMETIQRYVDSKGCRVKEILASAPSAKIALELYLYENAFRLTQPALPHGCMIVTAATNCSQESACVQEELAQRRSDIKAVIQARLQRGIDEGDVAANTDTGKLANFYSTIVNGMTIQARDGASTEDLLEIGKTAMEVWPSCCQGKKKMESGIE